MRQIFRLTSVAVLTLSVGLCTAFTVQAAEQEDILQRIARIQTDSAALQEAVEAGKERTLLCQYCHGADGYSLKPEVPNLAGQNVGYLLTQIDAFSRGVRKDFVMNQLAEKFTTKDKVNVALFYHTQPVREMAADDAMATQGKPLYQRLCSNCHGENGHGNESLARLAGQRSDYVVYSLRQFRAGAAGQRNVQRRNPLMAEVARDLSDKQIRALAAYVAHLP